MPPKKKKTSEAVQDVEQTILHPRETKQKILEFISTGSWLLNLALSDRVDGGYLLGSVVSIIGDSASSKTTQCLATLAEAIFDPRFDNYQLVYDEPEAAMNFDLEKMFGEQFIQRVRFIPEDRSTARTIQDWHRDLMKLTRSAILHVTDSFDALTSEEDMRVAEGDGLKKGGWRTEKAAIGSAAFPMIVSKIEGNKSLMLIIFQTRDLIGATYAGAKTRSGGNAPRFYSAHEVWLGSYSPIYKIYAGNKIEIGGTVNAKVAKNKVTGKKRKVQLTIYEYGVDNIATSVNWLIEYGFWTKSKEGFIDTGGDFGEKKYRLPDLIKHIESNQSEEELKNIMQESWDEVEKELAIDRKPKYQGVKSSSDSTPEEPITPLKVLRDHAIA